MTSRKRPSLPRQPPSVGHPSFGGMLDATNEGDARRAAIVLNHFEKLLLSDRRVVNLYEAWGRQSGLSELSAVAAEARRKLGRWTAEEGRLRDELPYPITDAGWIPRLDPQPWHFVRQILGLSQPRKDGNDAWLWLARELLEEFRCHVITRAIDRPGARVTRSAFSPVVAPPLTAVISETFAASAAGKLPSDQIYLLDLMAEQWLGRDRSSARTTWPTEGRSPKHDTRYLEDAAEWFYELHVQQPPAKLFQLGRAYRAVHQARDGQTVTAKSAENVIRNGSKLAERLLTMVRV